MDLNFDRKVAAEALESLNRARSQTFLASLQRQRENIEKELEQNRGIWNLKPIDFSFQLYQKSTRSSRNPKSSHTSKKTNHSLPKPAQRRKTLVRPTVSATAPSLFALEKVKENGTQTVPFIARCRPPSPQASKVEECRDRRSYIEPFSSNGALLFKRDTFRQDESYKGLSKYGIHDFRTAFTPDPFDINFKKEMLLKTLEESGSVQQISFRDCSDAKFETSMPKILNASPERQKFLVKSPYRRGKSPSTALVDRVCEYSDWVPENERFPQLSRPDIYDYKTKDWCHVTKATREADGPFTLA